MKFNELDQWITENMFLLYHTKMTTRSKMMIGTKAYHQLGDISRDIPDLCIIQNEDAENYYGSWLEGFGFINVRFPKYSTRHLTLLEHIKYDCDKNTIKECEKILKDHVKNMKLGEFIEKYRHNLFVEEDDLHYHHLFFEDGSAASFPLKDWKLLNAVPK